jgi:asparagine synthase (glutamine-hydrolysing)
MDKPVKTFSIGFNESSFNELPYAMEIVKKIGSEHHEKIVSFDAVSTLPKLVWHAEEPTADSSMLAYYHLAQMTRQHVKMALGGDGADEILAGYETYQAYYLRRFYRLLPAFLRKKVITPFINALPPSDSKVSWDYRLKRFVKCSELSADDAHASWRMIFDAEMRKKLLAPIWDQPGAMQDVLDLYHEAFSKSNVKHPLNRMLFVDTRFYLPNDMLVKVDRMTMAHGLEAREPFLDYRLVEFVASLPPKLKLRYFIRKKYILKAAARGRLPATIIRRSKKGFNVPHGAWIKRDLKTYTMDLLSKPHLNNMGFLDARFVAKMLQDHFTGKMDFSHQIWGLMTLVHWWDQFIRSAA